MDQGIGFISFQHLTSSLSLSWVHRMSSESPGIVNRSTSLNMFTRGLVIEGNIARRGNIKLSDPNLIKLKNEIKKPIER